MKTPIYQLLLLLSSLASATPIPVPGATPVSSERAATLLGIQGATFTVNGSAKFLLGFSYYGALSASEDFIRQDLDDLRGRGFNWLRVWATWDALGQVVSAVDAEGNPREPFLSKLKWLVEECDRRGMIVDVTLSRHAADRTKAVRGLLPDFAAHQQVIRTLVHTLKAHRNWYLDLANERDVRDPRYVSPKELTRLRELVRSLDSERLVTASFGGHDLTEEDVHESVLRIGLDFLSPHRPRTPQSSSETEPQTRSCLSMMKKLGRVVPVHYQEPFRRGYERWQPKAEDFLADLRGAIEGGAAGWCFHNGTQRGAPDSQPRRSFDLRQKRLMDQLDSEELEVVKSAGRMVK